MTNRQLHIKDEYLQWNQVHHLSCTWSVGDQCLVPQPCYPHILNRLEPDLEAILHLYSLNLLYSRLSLNGCFNPFRPIYLNYITYKLIYGCLVFIFKNITTNFSGCPFSICFATLAICNYINPYPFSTWNKSRLVIL